MQNYTKMVRIGLIRERKSPSDSRVVLTPTQAAYINANYKDVEIVVEPSTVRCFNDEEYLAQGIKIVEDLSDCDILLGVKEVPIENLIPNKTFCFFSHTKKMQPYNKGLMQALIEKKISMVDYECLTFDSGQRILGFGVHAGIVGAHNGLLAYGKKHEAYDLPIATSLESFEELVDSYKNITLPKMKIVVTGSGRVPQGAMDVLNGVGVKQVSPQEFLNNEYDYAVYALLKDENLYNRKSDSAFERQEFYTKPELYKCLFKNYMHTTDLLINGIYWEETIDALFIKSDIQKDNWQVSVISDITCDINGSVPINVGASTIADPVYGINKSNFERTSPFQNTKDTIDVMAVDNLPNELPRDASKYFGKHIEEFILKELLSDNSDIINRATICKEGKLTENYSYMSDYAYNL